MRRYEPIVIRRSTWIEDSYGDLVEGPFVDHLTFEGKFAPNNPGEPVEVGRNAVITGGTVYVRDLKTQPDILSTDRALIRGVEYPINGEVGEWQRLSGWAIQFAVELTKDQP